MRSAAPGTRKTIKGVFTSCPTCGWRPTRPVRGGEPARIGSILADVVHPLGRCTRELIAEAKAGRP